MIDTSRPRWTRQCAALPSGRAPRRWAAQGFPDPEHGQRIKIWNTAADFSRQRDAEMGGVVEVTA